jgi:hypothetical protein
MMENREETEEKKRRGEESTPEVKNAAGRCFIVDISIITPRG